MQRFRFCFFIALSLSLMITYANAGLIIDSTAGTATNNGVIGSGEYVGGFSGINSGFGNVIGSGSTLYVDSSITGLLNFGLTRGSGSFNDAMVIYVDSTAGGFSGTGGFTDTADAGRRAISGFDGTRRSTLNFASGFAADFAITLDNSFAGLFSLANGGSHGFVTSANRSNTGNDYEMNLLLANIGVAQGGSFRYFATYLNSGNAFRSDEFNGVATFAGGNPGNNTVNLANGDFHTFVSAVPEPGSILMFGIAMLSAMPRRKRC